MLLTLCAVVVTLLLVVAVACQLVLTYQLHAALTAFTTFVEEVVHRDRQLGP